MTARPKQSIETPGRGFEDPLRDANNDTLSRRNPARNRPLQCGLATLLEERSSLVVGVSRSALNEFFTRDPQFYPESRRKSSV